MLKFRFWPWIFLGLQNSISVKNKLLTNFTVTRKNIEIYSPHLWRKVIGITMQNILRQIEIMIRTGGERSNTLFL